MLTLLFNYDFSVLSESKQKIRITNMIANSFFISYISKSQYGYFLIVFKHNSNSKKTRKVNVQNSLIKIKVSKHEKNILLA